MENATFVIAVIGCVTGLVAIFLHFYDFLLSRSRIKLLLDKTKPSYIFNAEEFRVSGYQTTYSAVVSLKISNASSHPVTINELNAFYKKKKKIMRHYNDFNFQPLSIKIDDRYSTSYKPSEVLKIPLRIESFDTVYGSIRLPFADEIDDVNFKNDEFAPIRIVLQTPRGKRKIKVHLYEYHSHHKGFRPR